MPAEITINVLDADVNRTLHSMIDASKDQTRPLGKSRLIMLKSTMKRLKGGVMPPLSRAYARRVKRTAALKTVGYRQTISSRSDASQARVGTNHPWAKVHEFGATLHIPEIRPKNAKALRFELADGTVIFTQRVKAHDVTIPARPIFRLTKKDTNQILAAFAIHNRP